MIAIMYDGLELGKFKQDNGKLKLELNKGIEKTWLPYIFELGYEKGTDMNKIISAWVNERVFPKNRLHSRKMLKELGLFRYDINKIAELTRCSLITDPYWLAYNDNDTYINNTTRGQIGIESYPYNSLNLANEENYIWRIQ